MSGHRESQGDSGSAQSSGRFRRWILAHAPWLWTPNGHDWLPTSWASLGALVVVIIVVGIVITLVG